ncbi:MAG: hypothetical protein MN733_25595 [Nitrososphaera sp.]|nr:hypothetical protein [Nitrososphaera sp.]
MSVYTLSQLVDASQRADLHSFTAPVLADAMKTINEEKAREVGAKCAQLIRAFLTNLETQVAQLRTLRQQETAQAKKVRLLDRALKYFGETANPLPVFKVMYNGDAKRCAQAQLRETIDFDAVPADAWEVPADWKPSAPAQ